MTQKEAMSNIGIREVYRHQKGQLFTIAGFAEHTVNKTADGEKEVLVILTRAVDEAGKADVMAMPVLAFFEPFEGGVRFQKLT